MLTYLILHPTTSSWGQSQCHLGELGTGDPHYDLDSHACKLRTAIPCWAICRVSDGAWKGHSYGWLGLGVRWIQWEDMRLEGKCRPDHKAWVVMDFGIHPEFTWCQWLLGDGPLDRVLRVSWRGWTEEKTDGKIINVQCLFHRPLSHPWFTSSQSHHHFNRRWQWAPGEPSVPACPQFSILICPPMGNL
jgi:hypothetical protein